MSNPRQAAAQARSDETALAYHLRPEPKIQCDNPQIIALAQQITADCEEDYDKALAIHDWVCDHIYYDYDAYYGRRPYGDYTALGTLTARKSVCAGYAYLTTALLRAAGIPARYVAGYAVSSGEAFPEEVLSGTADTNHAWTEAFANGRWITMDTTWDSGNRWEYGSPADSRGCYRHLYFDPAPHLFAATHAVLDGNCYKEVSVRYSTASGAVMVPLDAIAKGLGATVSQDAVSDPGWVRYSLSVNDHLVQFWNGYHKFYVDSREHTFPTIVPQKINGVLMVPASLFTVLGCRLASSGSTVTIGFTS